ncbi:unnamed protein product [Onchocerca flexuosa]|uniref:60S ribosomal protein L28 n=1 Tax=Onchocerca flexuosa TaxID=387005 RepID=A0A183HVW2_9BILA|nr:unnamed protein product [Onchocerca flexuosa]
MITKLDPSAALLEFSESFKKVRRSNTITIKNINGEQFIGQRNVHGTTVRRYGKVRSTSLPNSADLYAVVRDNDKRLRLSSTKKNSNEMNFRHKNQCQRDRFNSLCIVVSSSLSFVANHNHYSANDYFGQNLQPNGPVDQMAKLFSSTIVLVSKLKMPNAIRQIYRVS